MTGRHGCGVAACPPHPVARALPPPVSGTAATETFPAGNTVVARLTATLRSPSPPRHTSNTTSTRSGWSSSTDSAPGDNSLGGPDRFPGYCVHSPEPSVAVPTPRIRSSPTAPAATDPGQPRQSFEKILSRPYGSSPRWEGDLPSRVTPRLGSPRDGAGPAAPLARVVRRGTPCPSPVCQCKWCRHPFGTMLGEVARCGTSSRCVAGS
ncbi:hypothetical protein E143388_07647 [Rhodococcus opacus]|nr:hypothetical protein E143388_07647 [Rhodococcus opacus]